MPLPGMPATHLRAFGYTARPADSAWGLEYADDYKKYAALHPTEAAARWRNPSAGQPPLVHFWYRESPQPLSAERQFHTARGLRRSTLRAIRDAAPRNRSGRQADSLRSRPATGGKARRAARRPSTGTSSSRPPVSISRNFRPPIPPGLRSPTGTPVPPGPAPTPPPERSCASKPPPGADAPCFSASSGRGPSPAA